MNNFDDEDFVEDVDPGVAFAAETVSGELTERALAKLPFREGQFVSMMNLIENLRAANTDLDPHTEQVLLELSSIVQLVAIELHNRPTQLLGRVFAGCRPDELRPKMQALARFAHNWLVSHPDYSK